MVEGNDHDTIEAKGTQKQILDEKENEDKFDNDYESNRTTAPTPAPIQGALGTSHHQDQMLTGLESSQAANSGISAVKDSPISVASRNNNTGNKNLTLDDYDHTCPKRNIPHSNSYGRSSSFALPGFLQTIPERDNEDDRSSMSSYAARSSTLGTNSSTISFLETVKNNSLKKWWHVMSGGPADYSTAGDKQKHNSSNKSQISGAGSNISLPQVHPNSQIGSDFSGSNGANISCVGDIPTFTSSNSLIDIENSSSLLPRKKKKNFVTYALIFLAVMIVGSIAAIVYLVTHPTEMTYETGHTNNDSYNNPNDPKNPDEDTITIDIDVTQTTSPTQQPTVNSLVSSPPTSFPTKKFTSSPPPPTKFPTKLPTKFPTKIPTKFPLKLPTVPPTHSSTKSPTSTPSFMHTTHSSSIPTQYPTSAPSSTPTIFPTMKFSSTQEQLLKNLFQSHYSSFQPESNSVHQIALNWFLYQDEANLPLTYIQLYENGSITNRTNLRNNQKAKDQTSDDQTPQYLNEKILVQRLMLVIICLELGMSIPESSQQTESNKWRKLNTKLTSISKDHECLWVGVTCDGDIPQNYPSLEESGNITTTSITGISFDKMQLNGKIPIEFEYFQNSLKTLSMFENGLSGPITNLYSLKQLEWLDLVDNALNGTVELHHFPKLEFLYLNFNDFAGTLPLPQAMEVIYDYEDYDYTKEMKAFVDEKKDVPFLALKLKHVWLSGNKFTGSLPLGMGSLSQLKILTIYSNDLTGEIPESISYLTHLNHLDVSYNNMKGPIPDELYSLTQLQELYLTDNQFTGEITHDILSLSNLEKLWLDGNKFTGYIPEQIGQLTKLMQLMVQNNDFSGSVPVTVCNKLTQIDVFSADCNATNADETYSFLECECCTKCE